MSTKPLTGFARLLRDAHTAGQDAFQTGTHWSAAVDRYEDDDLRRAFIAGWTEAENT